MLCFVCIMAPWQPFSSSCVMAALQRTLSNCPQDAQISSKAFLKQSSSGGATENFSQLPLRPVTHIKLARQGSGLIVMCPAPLGAIMMQLLFGALFSYRPPRLVVHITNPKHNDRFLRNTEDENHVVYFFVLLRGSLLKAVALL